MKTELTIEKLRAVKNEIEGLYVGFQAYDFTEDEFDEEDLAALARSEAILHGVICEMEMELLKAPESEGPDAGTSGPSEHANQNDDEITLAPFVMGVKGDD